MYLDIAGQFTVILAADTKSVARDKFSNITIIVQHTQNFKLFLSISNSGGVGGNKLSQIVTIICGDYYSEIWTVARDN